MKATGDSESDFISDHVDCEEPYVYVGVTKNLRLNQAGTVDKPYCDSQSRRVDDRNLVSDYDNTCFLEPPIFESLTFCID